MISDKEQKYTDLQGELQVLEEQLAEHQSALAWLQSPDYKPEENPDHELKDFDIEWLENQIVLTQKDIAKTERLLAKYAPK